MAFNFGQELNGLKPERLLCRLGAFFLGPISIHRHLEHIALCAVPDTDERGQILPDGVHLASRKYPALGMHREARHIVGVASEVALTPCPWVHRHAQRRHMVHSVALLVQEDIIPALVTVVAIDVLKGEAILPAETPHS